MMESSLPHTPDSSAAPFLSLRIKAGLALALCLGLLVVGACLDPAPAGYGTHQQLGLSSCGLRQRMGRACPTCGMTTAFSLASQGRVLEGLRAQPAGALLALMVGMGAWSSLWVLVVGNPRAVGAAWRYLANLRVMVGLLVFILLSWGYNVIR